MLGADTGQPEDEDSVTEFPAADYAWLNDTTDGATAFTAATTNVYILLVKATDPSGAFKTQPVAVTVRRRERTACTLLVVMTLPLC